MILRRKSSPSPTSRSGSEDNRQSRHRRESPTRSPKARLFCWNCDSKGHDARYCHKKYRLSRQLSKSPPPSRRRNEYKRPSRKSSPDSRGHLNSHGARRNGDTPSDKEEGRPEKNVRFSTPESHPSTSSRKHRHRE